MTLPTWRHVSVALLLFGVVAGTAAGGSFTILGPRTFVRATGQPIVETVEFAAPATEYVLHIESDGVASAVIALNGSTIVTPSAFNNNVRTIDRRIALVRVNRLSVEVRGAPGGTLRIWIEGTDNEPPQISALASPPANPAGWNNTDVTVAFTCTDAISGIATCPAPVLVSAEGARQIITGEAIDRAGNRAEASITLNIDKTPPAIAPVLSPLPNAAGWNNVDVTVSFTCTDALSGVADCSPPEQFAAEGANQVAVGRVVDQAGNSASASATVNLDKTAPHIAATLGAPPNDNGWYAAPVTIAFTCDDAGSGITSCPSPVTVSGEGEGQLVRGIARDQAGNSAETSLTVNLDLTAPRIVTTLSEPANPAGWHRRDVTVTFTCADDLSGAIDCPAPVLVSVEGAHQEISGTVTDRSGRSATASIVVSLDKTPPTIAASAEPAANEAGWHRTPVVVSFTCNDSTSGVASCTAPLTVAEQGTARRVDGIATDQAGNDAAASIMLNVDLTPPTIQAVSSATGLTNTDVTVEFVCADGESGIASCPAPVTISSEGLNQTVEGIATDRAGHSSRATASVSIDKTKPTIVATASPAANAEGWNTGAAVTVSFSCDDTGSGVATCSAPVDIATEGANQPATGTATDRAGNTASATLPISLDRTPPAIVAEASTTEWTNMDAFVHFVCTDTLSGIAFCTDTIGARTDGVHEITGAAVDRAGNQSSAGVTLRVDKIPPTITASPDRAPNAAGWYNAPVTVTFACADTGSGVAQCPPAAVTTHDGAAQVLAGTVSDIAGNSASASFTANVDTTPPTIRAVLASGWNAGDTIVNFECADEGGSGIATCPGQAVVTSEGVTEVRGTAVDAAGNAATVDATVQIDRTPPTITATASRPPNARGWYNQPVRVEFQCADSLSPIVSCPPPVDVTAEGAGQVIAGAAVDAAGNTATASVTVNLDVSPPTVLPILTPNTPWSTAPVVVTFECADALSGVATCPMAQTVSADGAAQTVSGEAIDNAGNQGIATVSVSVDLTAPVIAAVVSPLANAQGWHRDTATIAFECSDAGSGVALCPLPIVISAEGPNQQASGTSRDLAGNSATASVVVNLDRTPPTLSVASPAPNSEVRVPTASISGTVQDALSGVQAVTCSGVTATVSNDSFTCSVPLSPGANSIAMTVTDRAGNTDQALLPLVFTTNSNPVARPGGPYSGETGGPIALSGAQSSDPDGQALTYAWSFGDGTNGTGASVTHTYDTPGTFTVELTVRDTEGATGTASTTATIARANRAPVANAGGPYTGDAAQPVTLSGSASTDPDGDTLTYTWNLGDGTAASQAVVSRAYPTPGVYNATLTVTDPHGASSTATAQVTIRAINQLPVASIGGPYSGEAGRPIVFDGSASSDPDNDPLIYSWAFGDGSTANGVSPTHAFATPGSYSVTLTVNDGRGGSRSASTQATVVALNQPPVAQIGGPTQAQVGDAVSFSAAGSADLDNDPLTFAWSFGDGRSATGPGVTHGFDAAGSYAVTVTVNDGRGGSSSASLSITIDAPPLENRPPVANPGGPYAGEANLPLAFDGSQSFDPDRETLTYAWDFGDGESGSGPAPSHVYVEPRQYVVTLTVTDARGASATATVVAVVTAQADRAPPLVSLSGPHDVLPGTRVTVRAQASDNVGVASVTFEIDGQAAAPLAAEPYEHTIDVPTVAAPGALIEVRVLARDVAGNTGAAQATLTITAQPDNEPPTVSLQLPASAAPGGAVRFSAAAADNDGVASVVFSAAGTTLGADVEPPFEATFAVPADAAPGSSIQFSVEAIDHTGNRATAAGIVTVIEAGDTTPPTVQVMAPQTIEPEGTIDISATATDEGGIAAVILSVDNARLATLTSPPYQASYRVPASAVAGTSFRIEARAVDFAGLEGSAAQLTRLVVQPRVDGLIVGEVFDDSTGLPLGDARVLVRSASGSGGTATVLADTRGRFAVAAAPGPVDIHVERDGFTAADRFAVVADGTVVELFDARLTPLSSGPREIASVLGGAIESGTLHLQVPAGALSVSTTLVLTPVGQQGIQAALPPGWSPIVVADLLPRGVAFATPATLRAAVPAGVPADTAVTLVNWDSQARGWRAIAQAAVAADPRTLDAAISTSGQFAWIVADRQPQPPPTAVVGELIGGVPLVDVPATVTTALTPQPRIIFYQPGVHSDVTGALTSPAPVPSGTRLWARTAESYRFRSGSDAYPDPTLQDLTLYQTVADGLHLAAGWVATPSLTFEPLSLERGVIGLELIVPPPGGALPGLLTAAGGSVEIPTGERLDFAPGAVSTPIAATIDRLDAGQIGIVVPPPLVFLGAVSVSITGGAVNGSGVLSVPRPAGLAADAQVLVARLVTIQDRTRFVLTALARVEGDRLVSEAMLPRNRVEMDGVRSSGRYVFLGVTQPVGFFAGRVIDSADQSAGGVQVSAEPLPIVALSRSGSGLYVAPAAVGNVTLTALEFSSTDRGTAAMTLGAAGDESAVDIRLVPQAPRVLSVTPANNAVNVSLASAIVIVFSEPIDPASVSGAQAANIVLATAGGTIVPAALSLSSGNSVATLRPGAPLDANASYQIVVAAGVRDRSGTPLGAPASTTFTTLDTVAPPPPVAGSISAAIPVNGSSMVRATQGTAGLHDQVSIINLTTGQITPVLLDSNGGFNTLVTAGISDKLRLVIVDVGGNETRVDLPRFSQTNADGSVSTAIGPEGGRVTGGSGEIVDVPAGAFPDGAVVTLKMIAEAEFPIQLTERDRRNFSFTAGVQIDLGGVVPRTYLNVGVPTRGGETEDDQWVVAGVVDNVMGQQRLNIVDTARVIGSYITTSSPPCPGVTGAGTYGFLRPGRPVGVLFGPLDRGLPGAVFAPFLVPGMITLDVPDNIWGVWDSVNSTVDSIAPYVANAQDIVNAFTGPGSVVCFPSLSGSVTVSSSRLDLLIPAGTLSSSDVEITVRNDTRGTPPVRIFPPFGDTVSVEGSNTDTFAAEAVNYQGVHRAITLTSRPRSFVSARVAGLAATDTRVVVRNETRNFTESVPYNPNSGVPAVDVIIEGVASDVYSAEIRGSAPRTLAPTVASYPFGAGVLTARAMFGSIDPTLAQIQAINAGLPPDMPRIPENGVRRVELVNLRTGVRSQILDTDLGDTAAVVGGAFVFPFDGLLSDVFEVVVYYNNGRVETVKVPNFHISVTDPRTGQVVRRVSGQTPPRGKPVEIDLGPPGAGPASLSYHAGSFTRVDPTLPIALRFSSPLDQASVTAHMAIFDSAGAQVAGQWLLSDGGRTAVFYAQSALRLDATYSITLSGVRDTNGRPLAAASIPLTTFKPIRLGRVTLNEGSTPVPVVDLDFTRQTTTGPTKTIVSAISGNQSGYKLHTIDVTDPRTPVERGHTAGGSYKRRVTLLHNDFVDIQYDVQLVPQQTGMSCWAAGFAMIVGWRDQISIDPSSIAAALGYWSAYATGLPGYDRDMFRQWGFVPEPAQSYSLTAFRDMLDTYGPLWVASRVPGVHIRVITGMVGDGTPDGTILFFNDPWEEGMANFTPANRGSQYTRTFAQFVTEQESLARLWLGVEVIPFLQEACNAGNANACAALANPDTVRRLNACAAGNDAECINVDVPGIYGTYIAHLPTRPAWVRPRTTAPLTIGTLPAGDPCATHVIGSTFSGDLAVASSWNLDDTYFTFFDVTDPVSPCVIGGKVLTANPERPNSYTGPGTFKVSGFARGVTTIRHGAGVAAYVAEGQAGIFAADIGPNIPEPIPSQRHTEGSYFGDFMDVVAFRDRLVALNNNYGADPYLEILTPDLAPVTSVAVTPTSASNTNSKVHRLAIAKSVRLDRNRDGSIGVDEVYDFALVGGAGGVTVVDISDLDDPQVVGRVSLPGIIRQLDVDNTGRLVLAGGDRTATVNGNEAVFLINLADPFAAAVVDPATGFDSRVSYVLDYSGGVSGFKIDSAKGRIYVGWPGAPPSSGGVDVWAFTRRGVPNLPPIANAGPDQTVEANTTVHLDGTASSDPDGDPITFEWTQTAGPPITLSSKTSPTPWFRAPDSDAVTLTFSLVVRDDYVASAPSTVTITVRKGILQMRPRLLAAAVLPATRQLNVQFDPGGGAARRDVTADPAIRYQWIGHDLISGLDGTPDITHILNRLSEKLGLPVLPADISVSSDGLVTINSAGLQVIRAHYGRYDSNFTIVLAGLKLEEISLMPKSGITELISELKGALGANKKTWLVLVTDNNGYVLDKGVVLLEDVVFKYLGGPKIGLADVAEAIRPLAEDVLGAAFAETGPLAGPLAKAATKLLGLGVSYLGTQFLDSIVSEDEIVATVSADAGFQGIVQSHNPGFTTITGTLDLGDLGSAKDDVITYVLPYLESAKIEPQVTTIQLSSPALPGPKVRTFAEMRLITSATIHLTGKVGTGAELLDKYLPGGLSQWSAGIDREFHVPATTQKLHVRGHVSPSCTTTGDETTCAVSFTNVGLGFYVPNLTGIPGVLRPIRNDYRIVDTSIAQLGAVELFDTHIIRQNRTGETPLENTVSIALIGSVPATGTIRVIDRNPVIRKELIGFDVVTNVWTYRVSVTNTSAEEIRNITITDETSIDGDAECHGGTLVDTRTLTIASLAAGATAELVVNVTVPVFTDNVIEAAFATSYFNVATGSTVTLSREAWTRWDSWISCTSRRTLRMPMINEVVVEPQRDWNDSGPGGNGISFDDVPGSSAAGSPNVTNEDQWIEFLTNTGTPEELRNWKLEFTDTGGTFTSITILPSMLRTSPGSPYALLAAPGNIAPTSVIQLRDTTNRVIDRVDLAAIQALVGPVTGVSDEAIARVPDGNQTSINPADNFRRRRASIRKLNP